MQSQIHSLKSLKKKDKFYLKTQCQNKFMSMIGQQCQIQTKFLASFPHTLPVGVLFLTARGT